MNFQQVRWDAVIVNYNASIFLDPCLRALSKMSPEPSQIIVVDNASSDDSLSELAGWPEANVIQSSRNLGYAGGANLGIRSSEAPFVVVLNPDVELDPDFGTALLRLMGRDSKLGVAGAKLRFPGQRLIQHAGGMVHWPVLTTAHYGEGETDSGQFDSPREVDFVTGAAIAIRREAFDSIEGFDESFYPAYWEDVDLCFRMRDAGWAVRYEPELTGIHHEGGGKKRGDDYFLNWTRNRLRMAAKHLSQAEWWQQFVPAEMERLRGELSAIDDLHWPIRSGAASIELLARSGGLDAANFESQLHAARLNESIETANVLADLADPQPKDLTASDGVLRRLKRFLGRFSGRFYAEELYWQQRQFNESVVRAIEAQDRLNREVVAQLLIALLLLGQHQYRHGEESYRVDDRPGPRGP